MSGVCFGASIAQWMWFPSPQMIYCFHCHCHCHCHYHCLILTPCHCLTLAAFQMSEHDSDDENEEGEGRPGLLQGTGSEGGGVGRVGPWPSLKPISAKDLEINRREFLQVIRM